MAVEAKEFTPVAEFIEGFTPVEEVVEPVATLSTPYQQKAFEDFTGGVQVPDFRPPETPPVPETPAPAPWISQAVKEFATPRMSTEPIPFVPRPEIPSLQPEKSPPMPESQYTMGRPSGGVPLGLEQEQETKPTEVKPSIPVISTLKEQPREWWKQSLPEWLGISPVEPKQVLGKGISPGEKAKSSNIIAMANETGLSPSFVQSNYDELTKKLGLRGIPTRSEMLQGLFGLAIAGGLATVPLATLIGVGTYMGVKELESVTTQILKGEKINLLAGRELKEFLGPLNETEQAIVDVLEFAVPGALSAKFMGFTRGKLTDVLKRRYIHEAWDNYNAGKYEAEKGKLLTYKPTQGETPRIPPTPPVPVQPAPPEVKPPVLPKGVEVGKPDVTTRGVVSIPPVPEVKKPEFQPPRLQTTEEPKIPEVEGLEYKGIQKIPDHPDQYVFTEKTTGDTFYTYDLSENTLVANRDRIKAKFEAPSTLPTGLVTKELPETAKPVDIGIPSAPVISKEVPPDMVPEELVAKPEAKVEEGITPSMEEAKALEEMPVEEPEKPGVFNVDDKLVMHSPHTGEDTIVNYRGLMPEGKAMVWTGKSQIAVPNEWLSKQIEKPVDVVGKKIIPPSKGKVKGVKEPTGDVLSWIRSKGGINPDTVSADVRELTQKESGFKGKSSLVRKGGRGLDELAQEFGWERGGEISTDELADAIKDAVQAKRKGVPRKPGVGSTEQEIDQYIRRQEEDHYRAGIYDEDPGLAKEETFKKLTDSFDDEIMGFKEELYAEGYSETDITRAIRQAQKDIETKAKPPDFEGIKKELAEELKPPLPSLSPTAKDQFALPGIKQGLEMKGAKEVTPTLEGTPLMEAATKAEQERVQPTMFGEKASIGKYDVGGGGAAGAAERPKEPPGPMVNIVEMPEMVELYNELSGGKYPAIKEKLRAFHGLAQGLYRTGRGKIDLRADMFADPAQAKATIAHEIFHFIDDLPEYILRQRGNIFGRIASLKNYMKKYLEAFEGAPGPLTDVDKNRLMKDAREALKLEKATVEEQATSFKDIKLLPEDVKAIWNDVEARSKIKPVYEFIVSLSEVEKNQIVREAMRGIVSEANQRRFRISQPIGDRPFKDWDQRLRDIFNTLVKEEVERRQLFTYDTMMSELKNLSVQWKPFTPIPGDKFTKYRFSPAELYADAGSVLLNNPALLAEKAPSFYKAFFRYIHRKPEVKQVYDDIQARIGAGEEAVLGHRREEVKAMFGRGEEALAELRKSHPYNILESLRTAFVSKREGLLKLKREVEKGGEKLDPAKNPDYWTEELPYISSPIFQTLRDINNTVLKPAQAKGITQSDIGEYLLYRREATERAKLANPKGYTEADALKQMDFLKKQLGDEKFNVLTDLVKKNWGIRQEDVIPVLEKAKVFSPDTMNLIKNNEEYATFGVREHLEEKYGSNLTAKIYRQIGTLKEVINPLTATVMKDMSLVRMAERKMIAEGTVNFLKQYFPKEIKPAETRWTGRYYEIVEPTDPKLGLIVYTQEGKVTGYNVPKSIANIFNRDPYDFQPILRLVSVIQSPLKQILVSKNPGWWIFNIQRDLKAMAKQIPGMDVWWHPLPFRAIKYAIKALPDAYKDVFKDISTEDVKAMYQIKALNVGRYWSASEMGPETHLDKIVQSFGETPAKYDSEVIQPFRKIWEYIKAGNMYLDKLGSLGERDPKIAAYKFMKETILSEKEIAHFDRKRAGSPDFWEKGGLDFIYNNFFWFSNAGKEGLRAAWEAAKEDPTGYTWKTIKYDVLPKLVMLAASAGFLGATVKKLMDNIPERDKGNYLTIPIGETPDNKTVYFVMPHDFQGQIIAGILWKTMRIGKAGDIGDIADYMAGGLPYTGLNPLLGLSSDWKQYLTGKNPYDSFRGKYVIPETVIQATGIDAKKEQLKAMSKYTSNQLGGGIAYRFKGKTEREIHNELEKILGLPVVGNFLSRFVRVSDAGRGDELRYVSEEVRGERATELMKIDKAIKENFIEPSKITKHPKKVFDEMVKDKLIKRHKYDDFVERLTNSLSYKLGTPESDAILAAKSTEEKVTIFLKIIEKQKETKKVSPIPPLFSRSLGGPVSPVTIKSSGRILPPGIISTRGVI